MKIHTDKIAELETLEAAGKMAGVKFHRLCRKGSLSHRYSYDVILAGSGRYGGQYGAVGGKTATWDEWGIFLGELYRHDPDMVTGNVGKPTYANAAHFVWATDNRFDDLTPEGQHWVHRWDGIDRYAPTLGYYARDCRCGAVMRWLGRTSWAEFART